MGCCWQPGIPDPAGPEQRRRTAAQTQRRTGRLQGFVGKPLLLMPLGLKHWVVRVWLIQTLRAHWEEKNMSVQNKEIKGSQN